MEKVILVVHLMVVTALVVLVLYQKSEGGALGLGQSGLFTGRGQANALTRATGILATIFFLTSIALTVLPAWQRKITGADDWTTAVDQGKMELKPIAPKEAAPTAGAPKDKPAGDEKDSIFDQLKRAQEKRQAAPAPAEAPKAAAPAEAPKPAEAEKPAQPEAKAPAQPEAKAPTQPEAKSPEPAPAPAAPAETKSEAPTTWKAPTQ